MLLSINTAAFENRHLERVLREVEEAQALNREIGYEDNLIELDNLRKTLVAEIERKKNPDTQDWIDY